jgi:hypothetical protein
MRAGRDFLNIMLLNSDSNHTTSSCPHLWSSWPHEVDSESPDGMMMMMMMMMMEEKEEEEDEEDDGGSPLK